MNKKSFDKVSQQDYMDITVEVRDKETGELVETKKIRTRSNIHQPDVAPKSKEKDGKQYEPTNTIILGIRMFLLWAIDISFPDYRRWWILHRFVKKRLLYPAFKVLERILGKNVVKTDDEVYKAWYNNHIRVFRHCWHESVKDIYRIMLWNKKKIQCDTIKKPFNETQDEFFESNSKCNSVRWRQLACDIFVTEMLNDTADREWVNYFVLRVCHETMLLYGVDVEQRKKVPLPGQFPVYLSNGPWYPEYFTQNVMMPVWLHPIERKRLDKEKKQEEMFIQNQPAKVVKLDDKNMEEKK